MSFKKRGPDPSRVGIQSLPSGITSEAVLKFYEALDCPRSLMAAMLFKYGEHDQLVGLECDPSHYNSSEMFRDAYLATSFLTKSTFLSTTFDRKQLALNKFLKFEEGCTEVNRIFSPNSSQLNEFSGNGKLLSAMRRKIERVLDTFDPYELFDMSSWGPGVSTLIKGEETFGAKKFQLEAGITRDLYPLVKDLFPLMYPGWWSVLESNEDFPHYEVGNVVVTVPKTSKIDRVIAIEPGLNLWLQLGLGRMIRRRLGRVGIDLTDQGRNQRLARSASITGELATVDFSSASDSISTSIVETLFSTPKASKWFEVMDLIRSKYGTLDKKVFRWSKFSSMGNGFTFDLQTLIFYCAAVVCCEASGVGTSDVSVYGDDVIVPTAIYDSFCSLSAFLGFTVNPQKSFSTGEFRESCGSHYFRGIDCKPVYLKDALSYPVRVFNFANTLRLRSHFHRNYGCDGRFRRLFYYLVSSVPKQIRFRVPATWSSQTLEVDPLEGGFISNLDEACPQLLSTRKDSLYWEGFRFKRLSWVAIKREVDYDGLLLAKLSAFPVNSEVPVRKLPISEKIREAKLLGNETPLRGRTRCVLTNASIQQWYDLGPWL
jgi:hypothetical protein